MPDPDYEGQSENDVEIDGDPASETERLKAVLKVLTRHTRTPDPAFIWPTDHAWCIANDVDLHWAAIGADVSVIDELVADPELNVTPAAPREDQPSYR